MFDYSGGGGQEGGKGGGGRVAHIKFKGGFSLGGELGVGDGVGELVGSVVIAIPAEFVDAYVLRHARPAPSGRVAEPLVSGDKQLPPMALQDLGSPVLAVTAAAFVVLTTEACAPYCSAILAFSRKPFGMISCKQATLCKQAVACPVKCRQGFRNARHIVEVLRQLEAHLFIGL